MLRSVRARRAMRTSANSHTHKQTQADVLDKMLLIWNPIKMWVATSSSVTNSSRRLSSTHDWLQANPSGTCARATVRSLEGGKKKEKRKNEIKQHQQQRVMGDSARPCSEIVGQLETDQILEDRFEF